MTDATSRAIAAGIARGWVPFAFGARDTLRALDPAPLGAPLALWPADTADSARRHALLHRMNAVAFGGMGMPMWVQLDCAALPSAFVGFAVPAELLPPALAAELGVEPGELAPVAEALATPTATPGRWMSWSLASVLPGHRLGLLSKALGFAALRPLGLREAWGVTQLDNPAVATHLKLGDLRVRLPWASMHTRPDASFVYGLDVPAPDALAALADGAPAPHRTADFTLDPRQPEPARALAARLDAEAPGAPAWIVSWAPDAVGVAVGR